MQVLEENNIFNILIDIVGFWGGNTLAHSASSYIQKPKSKHILAYAIADLIVRKKWLGDKLLGDIYLDKVKFRQDVMVAIMGSLGGMLVDMGQPTENLIRGAVGLASNYILDGVVELTPLDNKYK